VEVVREISVATEFLGIGRPELGQLGARVEPELLHESVPRDCVAPKLKDASRSRNLGSRRQDLDHRHVLGVGRGDTLVEDTELADAGNQQVVWRSLEPLEKTFEFVQDLAVGRDHPLANVGRRVPELHERHGCE